MREPAWKAPIEGNGEELRTMVSWRTPIRRSVGVEQWLVGGRGELS